MALRTSISVCCVCVCVLVLLLSSPVPVVARAALVAGAAGAGDVAAAAGHVSYAIVVDGGSTGSRLFVYEAVEDGKGSRTVRGMKGMKVSPGLSEFGSRPKDAVSYIRPVFEHAVHLIPAEYHSETQVYLKATAGMRLLPKEQRVAVYDALCEGLLRDPEIPFRVHRQNIGTITGDLEAYYAVLSANYLGGRMDGSLRYIPSSGPVIGALDMGGSSTQIVFYTGDSAEQGKSFTPEDFWSHSFLSYGVGAFRETVWEYLTLKALAGFEDNRENPCDFSGREEVVNGVTLRGTGRPDQCMQLIKKTLWPHGECSSSSCAINGVSVPPVQGEFYGMSVFFYGLNAIHVLGSSLAKWPKPSLKEIVEASSSFCQLDWEVVSSSLTGVHPYTRDAQLPYRCFEALYMTVLLRDGYGFNENSHDITLALEVEGMEVEWTLGYALAELENTHRSSNSTQSHSATPTTITSSSDAAAASPDFIPAFLREVNNSLQGYISKSMEGMGMGVPLSTGTITLNIPLPSFALTVTVVLGGVAAVATLMQKQKRL